MILKKYKHLETPEFILKQINEYINLKPVESFDSYSFFNVTSNDSESFLYDSFRFKKKKGTPYSTIPFSVKYPTFKSLNSTQRDFYFYWRKQCVDGNFIDTELSYIFLFCYELINYSYDSSAALNVSMLVNLFDAYSNRFPKLEEYLPNWISDMLFELGEVELSNEYRQEESLLNKDYFEMANQSSIKNITMNNWWRFIEYKNKSAFFSKNTTKIYTVFKDLLEFLDAYYRKKDKDTGLFEMLFPLIQVNEERNFFEGAVLKREVAHKKSTVEKRELSKDFSLLLSEVMKISENYLRAVKNYDLLEIDLNVIDYDLVENMLASLTRFNTEKRSNRKNNTVSKIEEKVVKVEFDEKNIAALSSDSEELQQIFEEKYYEEEEELISNSANLNSEINDSSNEKKSVNEIFSIFKEIQSSFDYEELEELTDLEKEFILLFEKDIKDLSFYSQFLRKRGIILGSFILTINEKFEDAFEDVIFELEDDSIDFNNIFDSVFNYLKGV